jgi:hypothetical protein
MQRLLVDDSRTFTDPGYAHRRARTSAEALEVLAELHTEDLFLDELWLDHHLGDAPGGGSDTTVPVVDYLAQCAATGAPYPIGVVVVHTSDPDAARDLLTTLRQYGYKTRRVAVRDALTDG